MGLVVAGVRCLGVSPVCPPHSQVLAHKEGSGGAVHPSASGFFVFVFFFSEPCQECRFSKLSVGQPDVLFQLTNCRMIFFFFSFPFRLETR